MLKGLGLRFSICRSIASRDAHRRPCDHGSYGHFIFQRYQQQFGAQPQMIRTCSLPTNTLCNNCFKHSINFNSTSAVSKARTNRVNSSSRFKCETEPINTVGHMVDVNKMKRNVSIRHKDIKIMPHSVTRWEDPLLTAGTKSDGVGW